MLCPNCGKQIDDRSMLCMYCGIKLYTETKIASLDKPHFSDMPFSLEQKKDIPVLKKPLSYFGGKFLTATVFFTLFLLIYSYCYYGIMTGYFKLFAPSAPTELFVYKAILTASLIGIVLIDIGLWIQYILKSESGLFCFAYTLGHITEYFTVLFYIIYSLTKGLSNNRIELCFVTGVVIILISVYFIPIIISALRPKKTKTLRSVISFIFSYCSFSLLLFYFSLTALPAILNRSIISVFDAETIFLPFLMLLFITVYLFFTALNCLLPSEKKK